MRVKKQNIGFWIYREEPTHTHTTHGVRDDASHPPPPPSLPPIPLMGGGADPIKGRGIDKGEGEEGGGKKSAPCAKNANWGGASAKIGNAAHLTAIKGTQPRDCH